MSLEQMAQLGEFIGGLAVIVTLIYLARQINQGTNAQLKETHRAIRAELNRAMFEPMTDPETMLLIQRACKNFDSLTLQEQGVMNGIWTPIFTLFFDIFAMRDQGKLNHQMAEQLDNIVLGYLQMPGTAQWFRRGEYYWPDEFVAHMEKLLKASNRPPALADELPWYYPEIERSEEDDAKDAI